MILEKGKSYVLFGNFSNPEEVQKQIYKKLGIKVVVFLNNVDTTIAMEYRPKKRSFIERLFRI